MAPSAPSNGKEPQKYAARHLNKNGTMDRCRCEEYAEAVRKLRFYTVGTLRPDIIDNYDRSEFLVTWKKHGVDYDDMNFSKPRAIRILPPEKMPENLLPKEARKIEQMWCPYMTPVVQGKS